MQEPEDKIHDATHPLCGFGGRQIVALGKITMPVTIGFVHNTRTEQVVFDIVDMEYPYNAIIGHGTLNAFEAILHPAYLCMKLPVAEPPELFQLKCLSPALGARPHLNGNNTSVPRI
jgi:hypothetical protein